MIIGVTLLAILAGVMAFLVLGGEGDRRCVTNRQRLGIGVDGPVHVRRAQRLGIGRGVGIRGGQRRVHADSPGDRLDRRHGRG